jgi:two-component system CheB/CheR fusion protein
MTKDTAAAPPKTIRSKKTAAKTPTPPESTPAASDPTEPPPHSEVRTYLVGIGASAGGLEALTALIGALPADLGIAYVVIQHLSPTHRSMMVQLLGRETALAVREITEGIAPEPDVIYVAPASRNVVLREGRFALIETKREALPKPSANAFFSSLATEKGEDAIGVILSGTGSDGTVGLREIKAAGGFTFAQTPESAKYTGMPQSAIDSGCVDWVMPPDAIAKEIAIIVRGRRPIPPSEHPQPAATSLKRLLMRVKQQTRIDFSGYKENTLWRRIERRMAANHLFRFEDYLHLTEQEPQELDRLAKDILISVTAFFRDPEAFVRLKEILRAIVAGKQHGDEIRIWVSGCATGEEAYSIAILLAETMGSNIGLYKTQIFATDIDDDAMSVARRGLYVEGALAELDPALISRYFTIQRGRYEISRTLRDMVVFARQDLVQDPSFLRLDLVSCRNVLIYLQNELQAKVLTTFHYGLKPGGYLFLGKSEGVFQQEGLFDPVDKNYRIYRRHAGESRIPSVTARLPEFSDRTGREGSRQNAEQRLLEAAVRNYVPAAILINGNCEIVHIHGNVTEYISIGQGKPSLNLQHMIRRELRTDMQLLQHQAEKTLVSAFGRPRTIGKGDEARTIRLAVHPLDPGVATQHFLVCFEPVSIAVKVGAGETAESGSGRDVRVLEDELVSTRERLQTVIEELETSNEEMQALNEEVQAANEELQSSNEELEAANEELQSTNEELTTVNEELQIRSAELAEALSNLERIQNSVGFPILVVNHYLRLTRFNSPAASMFSLAKGALGQTLSSLRLPPGMADFSAAVLAALKNGLATELSVFTHERHYHLHITPYAAEPGASRGAILTLVDDTERLTQEREIRASRERLLSIMNNSTALITLKDLAGRYEFVNRQFAETFGLKAEELIGKTDVNIFPARIADDFRSKELDAVRRKKAVEAEDEIVLVDGEHALLSIRFPLLDADGIAYGICTQSTDITARKRAEHQLKLAARVFDRSSEGIVVTDAKQNILTINDAFTTVTGYTPAEAIGKTPRVLHSGRHGEDFYREMWDCLQARGWWQGEVWNKRKNGEVYPEWLTINVVHDANGTIINYIGIFSDITIVKDSQRRVEFLATHDELTSLPNRTLFLDRIRQAIARAERQHSNFAVLFIDLDNFKFVNDSLGHSSGDELLREISSRLRLCTRAVDTVARFGGDEFALLLDEATLADADTTATRIREALQQPVRLGNQEVHASASIGICLYPDDGAEAQQLLKNADTAMYQAKESGKSTHHFFTQDLRRIADERLQLENGLRRAIDNNELVLHYQPQIDLASGTLVGLEALVRWNHPDDGLISPQKFIPIAEKSRLIDMLGDWVLNEACRQMAHWLATDLNVPNVSINISAEQFRRGNLVATMLKLLQQYHLPAQRITLELTESGLMADAEHVLDTLRQLKALDVKLSIDDFGTGYSSLSYLRRYPLDELKIDRSFIDEVVANSDDRAITKTILAMADTLKLTVVAEGVETHEQALTLRKLGCPLGQGYLFAKPMPAEQVARQFGRSYAF